MFKVILAVVLIVSLSCIHITEEHEPISSVVSLKSDTGKYLSRCNRCWLGDGAYPDSAFVHETNPSNPWAKWTVESLGNGKYTLKGDNGKYLSRCNNCVTDGAYPDSAFVHETNPSNPWAQWTIKSVGNGKYTLMGDNGKYLSRCNNCGFGAYPDSAFVHETNPSNPWAQWELVSA